MIATFLSSIINDVTLFASQTKSHISTDDSSSEARSVISSNLSDSKEGLGDQDSTKTLPKKSFQHPIEYLDPEHVKPIPDSMIQDLELMPRIDQQNPPKSIYDRTFQPKHRFAKDMLHAWVRRYTTDQAYLKDTQAIVQEMGEYQKLARVDTTYCYGLQDQDCQRIMACWDGLHADNFLDKYNYMEWQILKHLNDSPIFLEILALGNIMSPIASLVLPIVFLLVPFIILKFQGLPITFDVYSKVLKQVAKNHFIGKALTGWDSISPDKILYLIFMFGLYVMQIYHNVMAVKRMYMNMRQLNQDLLDLQKFCKHSIHSMDTFLKLHNTESPYTTEDGKQFTKKQSYNGFCEKTNMYCNKLRQLSFYLDSVTPFNHNLRKLADLGQMLGIYYQIYNVEEYRNAIQYAIGFEGYIDNLSGIYRHWNAGRMSMIEWSYKKKRAGKGATKFVKQYYAGLVDPDQENSQSIVRNTVSLKKNWIITGPNASGKTTLLKTTAINVILTQQIGCGFYGEGSCLPRLYTHLHSYLNIPDTSERDSLFQAEARRCKTIIDAIDKDTKKSRHFCIFDELYSGTNPKEASKAAYAFLKYLSVRKNVDYILTTHYVDVCKKFDEKTSFDEPESMDDVSGNKVTYHISSKLRICNHKMIVNQKDNTFEYTYKVKPGISNILGAGQILKDMNYPKEIMGDFHNDIPLFDSQTKNRIPTDVSAIEDSYHISSNDVVVK